MADLTESELIEELNRAEAAAPIGARYHHYRSPDHTYIVTGHVILEATSEAAVVYQAEYMVGVSFARALSVWQESIEHNGATVPRFKRLAAPGDPSPVA